MIVQNVGRHGIANLTFTVPKGDTKKAAKALESVFAALGGGEIAVPEPIAKLSGGGVGMNTHSGVAATLFSGAEREASTSSSSARPRSRSLSSSTWNARTKPRASRMRRLNWIKSEGYWLTTDGH